MRFDVAIIGAGADGLAAASLLARAGRKVVVLERASHAGGRCVTTEFAPGFLASPYADTVAAPPPLALPLLGLAEGLTEDFAPVGADIVQRRARAFARVLAEVGAVPPRGVADRLKALAQPGAQRPWPGADWADQSIADLRAHSGQGDWRAALAGRATDPELAGSALTLFAAPQARARQGGLGSIGAALELRARNAGAELRFGHEISEVVLTEGRAAGVVLPDGRLDARAVISTLDFKRTFLGLFRWSDLPPGLLRDTGAWRMEGARARLLLALEAPPGFAKPFFVPGDDTARAQFRHGVVPLNPPMLVDPVSARDPSLAPAGQAVVTLTLSCIPARLFDGPWSEEKRQLLLARALERLTPLALPRLLAAATIVPPDMEDALGLTGGDLDGGLLAPDQMLGFRPGPRTPVPRLYLAGPSSAAGPLGLGAAGIAAAVAVMTDLGERRMSRDFDFIVVGASVGGLAAAAYLARGGAQVLVVEKELAPPEPQGALFALDPAMVADLRLAQHGLSFRLGDLSLTGWDDENAPLTLGRDRRAAARAIARLGDVDAEAWGTFQAELSAQARTLARWWSQPERAGNPASLFWHPDARRFFERLSVMGAADWLARHFESPRLIGLLLQDSVSCGFAPSEPGSALALVWRAAQEMAGQPGAVSLAVPGTLVAALRRASSALVQPGAAVAEIMVSRGAAVGVRLDDGEVVSARAVLSSLPRDASERLAGLQRPDGDVRPGTVRLGFTIGEELALPPELQAGRCVAVLPPEDYADAHEAARTGKLPVSLPFEVVAETPRRLGLTLPVMPLSPPQGWPALRVPLAARTIRTLSRSIPGLAGALTGVTLVPPKHRPRASLKQLLAPAFERAVTRVPGLYLCGEDAEPVPCVSGRAGRFAAHFVLKSR